MWISCVHFAFSEFKISENNFRLIGNERKGIKKNNNYLFNQSTNLTNQYVEENNRYCLYIETEKQVHT